MLVRLLLRTGRALMTAWLIASAVFLLSRSSNNRPALLSDDALPRMEQAASVEAHYHRRLGLDAPTFYFRLLPWRWYGTPNQYHVWLTDLARGELGLSFRDGVPVQTHLRTALAATLPLTLSALLLAAALALAGALWAAQHPGRGRGLLFLAYLFDSLPLLVVSLLLLLLLANPDAWALFPAYGLGDTDSPRMGLQAIATQAYHLVLPVLALTLVCLPPLFLPTVAALRHQGKQPYVTTARAKGLPAARVWRRHVLPNALPVFITRFSDLLPGAVAGAVVVEMVFALPGTGRLLAEAAAARDLPVLVGSVLLTAAVRLLAWLLADVATARLDARSQPI